MASTLEKEALGCLHTSFTRVAWLRLRCCFSSLLLFSQIWNGDQCLFVWIRAQGRNQDSLEGLWCFFCLESPVAHSRCALPLVCWRIQNEKIQNTNSQRDFKRHTGSHLRAILGHSSATLQIKGIIFGDDSFGES